MNGIRTWYEETGEGDPVIQIHGAGFGHFNFATATPILSQTFRCIDFDMRGYGQSERPLQQYNMEVWADDIAGLMNHLGLHPPTSTPPPWAAWWRSNLQPSIQTALSASHQLLGGQARLCWCPYFSRMD